MRRWFKDFAAVLLFGVVVAGVAACVCTTVYGLVILGAELTSRFGAVGLLVFVLPLVFVAAASAATIQAVDRRRDGQ